MSVWGQAASVNKVKFSFDIGLTGFLFQDTSVNDILEPFGYTDIDKWELSENLTAGFIGLNLHHKNWAIGVGAQQRKSFELDVHRTTTPYIDQIGSKESWWSAYVERSVRLAERYHPFFAVGAKHSTLRGFSRISGEAIRVKVEETDPFLRVGVSYQPRNMQLRVDLTKRFTDSDTDSHMRVMLRTLF